MKRRLEIGITYGDPSGIGPEILIKVLQKWNYNLTPIIFDPQNVLFKKSKHGFKPGVISPKAGQYSFKCLENCVKYAKTNKLKAIITGPVSKLAINKSGIKFTGQTEAIADMCKVNKKNVIMLFAQKDFRIALYSRHIPLKEVSKSLNKKDLKNFLVILEKELKEKFKILKPKIAVLGLNPHAGEDGLFGSEEKRIIIPVIKELLKKKMGIYGPFSADAMLAQCAQNYLKSRKQNFDVLVSFYHDQALPVFKGVCGFNGLNITLGLPFLRVSVDHGTAFDIAGKNIADGEGMKSAVKFVNDLLI